jgi:hypothetical protein
VRSGGTVALVIDASAGIGGTTAVALALSHVYARRLRWPNHGEEGQHRASSFCVR